MSDFLDLKPVFEELYERQDLIDKLKPLQKKLEDLEEFVKECKPLMKEIEKMEKMKKENIKSIERKIKNEATEYCSAYRTGRFIVRPSEAETSKSKKASSIGNTTRKKSRFKVTSVTKQ
jgi:type I site-specific restriction-modification system R (restriction) subunit